VAGISADDHFEKELRRWRRQIRPRLALAVLLALAAFLGLSILWPEWRLLYIGAGLGLSFTFCAVTLDTPPRRIENWRRGAEGERRTAKVLDRLGKSGWVIVHDVPAPRGNLDHVVAGPSGLFVLETKTAEDGPSVEASDGSYSRWQLESWARQARGNAVKLRQMLGPVGLGWINAVVVVWADFPDRVIEHDKVTYVHGEELAAWLEGRPQRTALTERQRAAIEALRV
jgi:hypothetical protein